MKKLTVGSCFSGIGGLELGLEWTGGFETKWQIEIDPYATKVLEKHWPGVQRFSDITTVAHPPAVDVICGGFPCQDVSLAGKGSGLYGRRTSLWWEMLRIIREVGPRLVLAENVPGLLSNDDGRFFGVVLRSLATCGFDAEWRVLSACSCGAPHPRERVFIVAYPKGGRRRQRNQNTGRPPEGTGTARQRSGPANGDWWTTEPAIRRVDDGTPRRVDRLRWLGNAVVPQVAQKIGEMILEYERNKS